MFTLSREPDDTVEFDDIEYKVDMSFDNILRLNEMLSDFSLTGGEQITYGLMMLLDEIPSLPDNKLVDLFYFIVDQLLKNDIEKNIQYDIKGNPMPSKKKPKADGEVVEDDADVPFDLEQDAEYIYASFLQAYNMDLFEQRGKLHWNKFNALLTNLPSETKFKEVIKIRTDKLPTGSKQQKEREQLQKLKKLYALKPKGVRKDG